VINVDGITLGTELEALKKDISTAKRIEGAIEGDYLKAQNLYETAFAKGVLLEIEEQKKTNKNYMFIEKLARYKTTVALAEQSKSLVFLKARLVMSKNLSESLDRKSMALCKQVDMFVQEEKATGRG
jgi:hypothetical protein